MTTSNSATDYNSALQDAAQTIECPTCRAELEACAGSPGDVIAFLQTRQLIAGARVIAHVANGHPVD